MYLCKCCHDSLAVPSTATPQLSRHFSKTTTSAVAPSSPSVATAATGQENTQPASSSGLSAVGNAASTGSTSGGESNDARPSQPLLAEPTQGHPPPFQDRSNLPIAFSTETNQSTGARMTGETSVSILFSVLTAVDVACNRCKYVHDSPDHSFDCDTSGLAIHGERSQ